MFLFYAILLILSSNVFKLTVSQNYLLNATENGFINFDNSVCLTKFILNRLFTFNTVLFINYVEDRAMQWPEMLQIMQSEHKLSFIITNSKFNRCDVKQMINKAYNMNYLVSVQNAEEIKDTFEVMELISIYNPLSGVIVVLDESIHTVNRYLVNDIFESLHSKGVVKVYVIAFAGDLVNLWYTDTLFPGHSHPSSFEKTSLCTGSASVGQFYLKEFPMLSNGRELRVVAKCQEPFVYKHQTQKPRGIETRLLETIAQKMKIDTDINFIDNKLSSSKIFSELIQKYFRLLYIYTQFFKSTDWFFFYF